MRHGGERINRRSMPISRGWFQAAILTYLLGFTILGILAYLVYVEQPPIPLQVRSEGGQVLFTRRDVTDGMNVFQRYGIMEYGSIYGHGAYLGPDFTADYLHRSALLVTNDGNDGTRALVTPNLNVAIEFHLNTYDPAADTLTWSNARARAHEKLVTHYQQLFFNRSPSEGMQANWIKSPDDIRKLTAFFAWTAWTGSANRPGKNYSYTNNWPPEPLVKNEVTPEAIIWSAASIIGLLGGMGLVLFFFGKYDWLGWSERQWPVSFRPVREVKVTHAQRVVVWFFLVTSMLFLLQTFLGGVIAHYRAESKSFFGWDISSYLPFNIARTWHLQLSIFWVATSYIATGIFMVPLISGREPRGQALLSWGLLVALATIVFGSMAGEYASVKNWLGQSWFWFGHQGWEYLDLGRFWQIFLVIGLFGWVFILSRGLRRVLKGESHGNMPWILFYAALAIPAFYAVGLLSGRNQGFVITDFWRFWVVHLWVEDFLELFTTVVVAYLFVLLGMVQEKTAIRVIYLDIILYSLGGVVGTMHHLYFSGAPAIHMALGATFSAMEVIPLLLLTLEAWAFMRSGKRSMADRGHPHQWAVYFLIAVGVWNFLGAGVFGFLINLPIVSYYEIGTNLTANHAHTAMMGVYGMLAVGLLLFCLRYLMREDKWSNSAAALSFWSLNFGLAWMAFVNLFPIGMSQLQDSLAKGYVHARSFDFRVEPWVNRLEWARLPGDALFILGGALPLLWICIQTIRHPNPKQSKPEETLPTQLFTNVERDH